MSVSSTLKAARALISAPGTWITCSTERMVQLPNGSLGVGYCAQGAIQCGMTRGEHIHPTTKVLGTILKKRFEAGELPTPTMGPGGDPPLPWVRWFNRDEWMGVLTQFNNSTSQEEVLKLFDEAIAMAERDEGIQAAVPAPTEPVKQEPKPEPVKVPERVLELV